MDDDALLTLTEAAEKLGVSKSLIIGWRKRKRDPLVRHGNKYRWADLTRIESETRNCGNRGAYQRAPRLLEAV